MATPTIDDRVEVVRGDDAGRCGRVISTGTFNKKTPSWVTVLEDSERAFLAAAADVVVVPGPQAVTDV